MPTPPSAFALAHLKKDYPADIAAYDAVHEHILMMADTLSAGIISQFPDRFGTAPVPGMPRTGAAPLPGAVGLLFLAGLLLAIGGWLLQRRGTPVLHAEGGMARPERRATGSDGTDQPD